MKLQTLARSLRLHPFFSQLNESAVEFLAGCTRNVRLTAGSYLFRENQSADRLYLLRAGEVDLESHAAPKGAVAVERLFAGEALGVSAVFDPHVWALDARAVTPVLVFAVDGACLRGKLEADAEFARAVLKRLLLDTHLRLERARLHQLDVYKAEFQSASPR